MSRRFLLDTNIVSHVIRGDERAIVERLANTPPEAVLLSAVSEAELLYGLAKRGHPDGLSRRIGVFLGTATVLPWTSDVAAVYGELRASIEKDGLSLAPIDLMIAAHAMAVHATLVTRDRAFFRLDGRLEAERW